VGADLGKDKRIQVLKNRNRDLGSKGFSSFLSNIVTFLISHLAIQQIDLSSILAYVVVLCKLAEERGSAFAVRYHHLLHNQILDKIRMSDHFALDSMFCQEQDHVIRKLESRSNLYQSVKDQNRVNTTVDHRDVVLKKPKHDRTPIKIDNNRSVRKLVCFKHKPHEGSKCNDPKCDKDHLDTTKPDLLIRYQKAIQSSESKRTNSTKSPLNQGR
jgi:hypothetical protein